MKKMLCAVLACMLAALLCSCSPKTAQDSLSWPAEAGGYTFKKAARKAVSLSPAVTESLFVLGYGGRLIGVGSFCTLPDSAPSLPDCGSAIMPDTAAIVELSPDILFTPAQLPSAAAEALQKAGVQTVVIPHAETLDGLMENYRTMACAFEGAEQAKLKVKQLSLMADTILQYTAENVKTGITEADTSAIYLRKLPFIIATGDTLEGALIERMGFVSQGSGFSDWSYPSEYESELNPDYIFCDESVSIESLQNSNYYKRTSAVTNARVYHFEAALFERQSPRMFFELERVMKQAFPEAFSSPRPSFVLEQAPPPEPEKTWWQKLFSK